MSVDSRGDRVRYTSLAFRLWFIIFLVVAGAILVVGVVFIYISRGALQDSVFDQQRATSAKLAQTVSAYMERYEDDLELVGRIQAKLDMDEANRRAVLQSLLDSRNPDLGLVALVDETGQEQIKLSRFHTYFEGDLVNQAEADFFTQAMSEQPYVSPFYTSEDTAFLSAQIAVPVQAGPGQARVEGVLVAEVIFVSLRNQLDELDGKLDQRIEIGETGYLFIVDQQGNLIDPQESIQVTRRHAAAVQDNPLITQFLNGDQVGRAQVGEYEGFYDKEVIGSLVPIEGTDWAIVVEIPASEVYTSLQRMIRALIGLLAAGLLVSAFTVYLMQRQLLRPVRALTVGAEQIAAGNLEADLPVPNRAGEITMLGRAFKRMQVELQSFYARLEEQVAERTRDLEETAARLGARTTELEETTKQLEEVARLSRRRALMLQASSEVSRAIAQIHDIDTLLPRVTQLISEHFGFYHAGIFLVDEIGRYAVLRAANSEGGQRMLARGHKLAVGAKGIVGHVTRTGQPRISLDVGADAVYFDNPDLPETRSEMALPLRLGGEAQEVIGALDVQSTEPAAFDQEDVGVLSALADQIAIAIQNARLFQQSQQALEETEAVYRRRLRAEWDSFLGGTSPRRPQTVVRSLGRETERE